MVSTQPAGNGPGNSGQVDQWSWLEYLQGSIWHEMSVTHFLKPRMQPFDVVVLEYVYIMYIYIYIVSFWWNRHSDTPIPKHTCVRVCHFGVMEIMRWWMYVQPQQATTSSAETQKKGCASFLELCLFHLWKWGFSQHRKGLNQLWRSWTWAWNLRWNPKRTSL